MKGNELDELFKNKLGHHKLTPPSGSWEKIDGNLSEKKSKGIILWLSVAASIVLIFTIGWLLGPTQDVSAPAQVAELEQEIPSKPDRGQKIAENDNSEPQIQPEEESAPLLDSKEEAPILSIPDNPRELTAELTAKNDVRKEKFPEIIEAEPITLERESYDHLSLITLPKSMSANWVSTSFQQDIVLPLDLGLRYNYSEESNEEIRTKRKFGVLNGIISIAKGVNKSKIGFGEFRNAKNGFVTTGLKYGSREAEEEEKKKADDGTTNAGDSKENAGDLK